MIDSEWKKFFTACVEILGSGHFNAILSNSWCSWTTFSRLSEDAGYWTSGLPNMEEISDAGIKDGGTWGQPFLYKDIAHIIVPKKFYWETEPGLKFKHGVTEQGLEKLSLALDELDVKHRRTDVVLEIKLY